MQSLAKPVTIRVKKDSALCPLEIKFEIDLSNTVSTLKYQLYQMTKIHPSNQILKFGTTVLTNDLEIVSTYGLT
jgi:hypothetical protein